MLDSALADRLVDILKIAPPSLQTKVTSIIEYWSMIEPCMDTIIATEIESTLIDVFKQIVPRGMEATLLCIGATSSIKLNMST